MEGGCGSLFPGVCFIQGWEEWSGPGRRAMALSELINRSEMINTSASKVSVVHALPGRTNHTEIQNITYNHNFKEIVPQGGPLNVARARLYKVREGVFAKFRQNEIIQGAGRASIFFKKKSRPVLIEVFYTRDIFPFL